MPACGLVALTFAAALLDPHEFATEVEREQAAAISASPGMPIPSIARMETDPPNGFDAASHS
jgi:hypothetical protein